MLKNIKYDTRTALVILCVIAFGLGTVCFLLTAYHTENAIGSPSSTSSLIIIFVPVYSIIGAACGGVLGFMLGNILRHFKMQTISLGKLIPMGLVFIVVFNVLMGLTGFMMVESHVESTKPHIIYTDGSILKEFTSQKAVVSDNTTIPFEQQNKGKSIIWNGIKVILSYPSDKICAINSEGRVIFRTSLKKYDYIRELQATEVKLSPIGGNYLAVLADLRATAHRTILLIYATTGQLVHQEMFDTRGRDITMGTDTLDSDSAALIIQNIDGVFYYSKKN